MVSAKKKLTANELLDILENKVIKCIELSATRDKSDNAKELIKLAAQDLLRIEFRDRDHANINFNHFVNKVLSTIEALGISDMQYKAVRKLVLSEIYACKDIFMANFCNKEEKTLF